MNNLWLLLKANKSNINIFKGMNEKKPGNIGKVVLIFFLTVCVLFSITSYAFMIAEPLASIGYTYVELSLFVIIAVLVIFMGGVYKSQGVLFTSKDNDMLLAMPIKKKTILSARLISLIIYQYIWTLMIMVPACGVYVYFEHPGATFYVLSAIMLIILPIIPTVVASVVGYIVSALSSVFKKKNLAAIIFNLIFMVGIFSVSFNLQEYIQNIAKYASSIDTVLSKIYLPLGIYIASIQHLDVLKFALMVLANIGIIAIFVYIFSLSYFKIISRLSERHASSNYKLKELKTRTSLKALMFKELKRYFSSTIYVTNTIIGLFMMLGGSIYLMVAKNSNGLAEINAMGLGDMMPAFILAFIFFSVATEITTCSSISIEGNTLWFTKSLPVSAKKIFKAKILTNLVIMLPISVISAAIACIALDFGLKITLLIALITILDMLFMAVFGLCVNLLLPKLDAENDTQVVKQSASPMICILGGLFIAIGICLLCFIAKMAMIKFMLCIVAILTVLLIAAYVILNKWGTKRLYKI